MLSVLVSGLAVFSVGVHAAEEPVNAKGLDKWVRWVETSLQIKDFNDWIRTLRGQYSGRTVSMTWIKDNGFVEKRQFDCTSRWMKGGEDWSESIFGKQDSQQDSHGNQLPEIERYLSRRPGHAGENEKENSGNQFPKIELCKDVFAGVEGGLMALYKASTTNNLNDFLMEHVVEPCVKPAIRTACFPNPWRTQFDDWMLNHVSIDDAWNSVHTNVNWRNEHFPEWKLMGYVDHDESDDVETNEEAQSANFCKGILAKASYNEHQYPSKWGETQTADFSYSFSNGEQEDDSDAMMWCNTFTCPDTHNAFCLDRHVAPNSCWCLPKNHMGTSGRRLLEGELA